MVPISKTRLFLLSLQELKINTWLLFLDYIGLISFQSLNFLTGLYRTAAKMIRGYVSSDEDDYDDYDFGYSEPLVIERRKPNIPEIQSQEARDKLNSALEESKKIDLFMLAVDRVNLQTLEELIAEGVSVDCIDDQNWSALMKACGRGSFGVVECLLAHGANPNKPRESLTPLMTCCIYSLVDEELKLNCVRFLLQHGANVNAKDKFLTTALMYAAGGGYASIVTELLTVPGINVNMQDKDGWNALFHAIKSNNLTSVVNLKNAGTNLQLKDKYERTAINFALDLNLKEIAQALGYVEEPRPVSSEKETLEERFIKELPDSKGRGGFYSDAREILEAFNKRNVKNISLPDLLNATEKDLEDIGVKLKPDRLTILSQGIHRYHLHPWRSFSLHRITPGDPTSLEDVIILTGAFAKHLTIANASLRYLSNRISFRQKNASVDLALEKEMIKISVSAYQFVDLMETSLRKIQKHVKKIKPEIPPDYIHPVNHKPSGRKWVKLSCYAAGTILAGLFLYFKSGADLRRHDFADLLVNQFSTFFHISRLENMYGSIDDSFLLNLNS